MEDIECVRLVVAGDSGAYRALIDKYKNQVFGLAYKMLGNPSDAEDAAQEVFVRAYTQIKSFDQSRKFSTWLMSIASHYCIDELRRRRISWVNLDDVAVFLESGEKGPEVLALDEDERRQLRDMLSYLPPKYKVVLILRYWQDLSIAEIAETLNATESGVKTMLHRARQMLAARILEKEVNQSVLSEC